MEPKEMKVAYTFERECRDSYLGTVTKTFVVTVKWYTDKCLWITGEGLAQNIFCGKIEKIELTGIGTPFIPPWGKVNCPTFRFQTEGGFGDAQWIGSGTIKELEKLLEKEGAIQPLFSQEERDRING